MTHNLTQNGKNTDGISGANRSEKDMFLDTIRLESTENIYAPPLSAAHNPEVVGSSPAAATRESSGFVKNPDDSPYFKQECRQKSRTIKQQKSVYPTNYPLQDFFLIWGIFHALLRTDRLHCRGCSLVI